MKIPHAAKHVGAILGDGPVSLWVEMFRDDVRADSSGMDSEVSTATLAAQIQSNASKTDHVQDGCNCQEMYIF